MKTKNACGVCGNALQVNDPGGICPNCLMGHALKNDANVPTMDGHGLSYPRADELVGIFPNLEILHLIGHGGMGAVYLARQTNLDRMVALKVLSPRLGNDPSFTERFTREARTLAKLSHPNIVTVFDFGQTERFHFLIMEYVEGINLREAIQDGKLTPEESLEIIPQICDALQFAHNAGVIHRDIKPENILLDKHGRVKIADFGLAKLLQSDRLEFSLTGTQQVLGTRNYMAPEQIEKPELVDHRADIYSLGVVFYELLTGELPIGRFAVPSAKAAVPHRLDDVVMRTLEKEPAQRFQQASEVRTAVEDFTNYKSPPPNFSPESKAPFEKISTLPFTIGVYGGMATAHGIAHLFADRLELEYEVIDDVLGAVKSSTHKVEVPLNGLVSIRFVKGVFSDRIDFQTDRLEIAKDVPNSRQGRFSLATKRADIEQANHFYQQAERYRNLQQVAAQQPEHKQQQPRHAEFRQPLPPRKSRVFGLSDDPQLSREQVIDALKIPAIGFMVVGVIHIILAAKGFIKGELWENVRSFNVSFLPGVDVSLLLPRWNGVYFSHILMLVVGIIMLSIASRLRRPRDYTYVYSALVIVMLAPVHSAYVLTFVFAIWSLMVLSDARCRDVFFTGRHDSHFHHRRKAHVTGLAIAAFLGVLAIVVVLGIAFLLASYRRMETKTPVDWPPPIIQKMNANDQPKQAVEIEVNSSSNGEPKAENLPGLDF